MQTNFYQRLYEANPDVKFRFVNNNNDLQKLGEEEKEICDRELTLEELSYALKNMNKFKAPGCDGLPCEFFPAFSDTLGPLLPVALNVAIEDKMLHISARQGIITLIPKMDRDGRYRKNWCPLTLLNTDYKILAKAIAYRIIPLLEKLIHPSQTVFIQG